MSLLLPAGAAAQTLLFSHAGDAAADFMGSSIEVVGDVDGDGAEDYAIGSWGNDVGGSNAGLVRVYSGSTQMPLYTWHGTAANDRFGQVGRAGDVNGDSFDDVLVGAPGGNYAHLYSGANGAILYQFTGPVGGFGQVVAGDGDANGDGVPDIMVGAPFAGVGGELVVYSGATGAMMRTHAGTCSGFLGYSAAFYGDVDGDGSDEYAVGRPLSISGCGSPELIAYDGATGTQLWTTSATTLSTDQLGWSVAPLADMTGDGVMELLVGAPQDPGVGCGPCNGKGFVQLLNGATGISLWQVNGTSHYAGLGYDLVGIGDITGDGFEDFAASQPSTESCGGNTRAVQIRNGLTGALISELPTLAPGDRFGVSLASGDVNNDGLRDLLVGTACDDAGGSNSGRTYVYSIVNGVVTFCEGKANSLGCTPTIFSTSLPSISQGFLRVRSANTLSNSFGLLLWGRKPQQVPFQGGWLCVQQPLVRTPTMLSGGNPPPTDCSGLFSFHFSGVYMQAQGIAVGEQIYTQFWSRDTASASGSGLSPGLAFTVLP